MRHKSTILAFFAVKLFCLLLIFSPGFWISKERLRAQRVWIDRPTEANHQTLQTLLQHDRTNQVIVCVLLVCGIIGIIITGALPLRRKVGQITSFDPKLVRNVEIQITPEILLSEISKPKGPVDAKTVESYHIVRSGFRGFRLWKLYFVLSTGFKVCFYTTKAPIDWALLLDELDGTIGTKPRLFSPPINFKA